MKKDFLYFVVSDWYCDLVWFGLIEFFIGKLDWFDGDFVLFINGERIEDIVVVVVVIGFDFNFGFDFLFKDVLEKMYYFIDYFDYLFVLVFYGIYYFDVLGLGFVGVYCFQYWGVIQMQLCLFIWLWFDEEQFVEKVDILKEKFESDVFIQRMFDLCGDFRSLQFFMGDYLFFM